MSADNDDERDGTRTTLVVTIAASGLISVAAFGMHIRSRNATKRRGTPPPPVLPGALNRAHPVHPAAPAPAASPVRPAEAVPPSWSSRPAPPPQTIPPDHNALDSVWSISAVPADAVPDSPPPPVPPRTPTPPPGYASPPRLAAEEPPPPRLPPPSRTIPPDHNALDSVWSISIVPPGDTSTDPPDRPSKPSWWRRDRR
ncbi:hypothetical protein [Yinghuangia sp. YIM S09857]|uniref:hypothetical protein n=1 Tax=Yinghuangia sp. YIM S09857 TaxID=3436929 RepID=UPI003F52BEF3